MINMYKQILLLNYVENSKRIWTCLVLLVFKEILAYTGEHRHESMTKL